MTDLFGVDFNTPNSAASYLATLQQFDAPHSFGEQGQSSSAATTNIENTNIEQQHHHIYLSKNIILNITLCQYPTNKIKKILAKRGERRNKIANHVRINFSLRTLLKLSN